MKAKDRPSFIVDKDFGIGFDSMQWTVYHRRELKNGGEGWLAVAFCRDLYACMKRILTIKSGEKTDITHVTDLLAWQSSIMHTMLDRLLRKENDLKLKEAIEVNHVMVSSHNIN